jgi:hypothetical protein
MFLRGRPVLAERIFPESCKTSYAFLQEKGAPAIWSSSVLKEIRVRDDTELPWEAIARGGSAAALTGK